MPKAWRPDSELIFFDDVLAIYADGYPVTDGHALIVPHFNKPWYIDECLKQARRYGDGLVASKRCDAYNIGMNCGTEAGQTIDWPHVHVIPRRKGDVADPRGGVRHVIPEKGNYKCDTL